MTILSSEFSLHRGLVYPSCDAAEVSLLLAWWFETAKRINNTKQSTRSRHSSPYVEARCRKSAGTKFIGQNAWLCVLTYYIYMVENVTGPVQGSYHVNFARNCRADQTPSPRLSRVTAGSLLGPSPMEFTANSDGKAYLDYAVTRCNEVAPT